MAGVDAVLHAATLHKPHVGTHSRQEFVDTNITGTLNLLEEAVAAGVRAFVFTSTTSAFGDALVPPPGAPAAWITEDVAPVPKNIYGVTKAAAEDLCELVHRNQGLACIVLAPRASSPRRTTIRHVRDGLCRRQHQGSTSISTAASISKMSSSAHLLALERAPALGFGRYIISATTPFLPEIWRELRADAPARRAALRPGIRSRISPPRLAHVPEHRPRLCQRARAARARLAAAL